MRKLFSIAKGWFIFLFYKRSQMSKDRLKKCFKCDMRLGIVCGVCFCELHAKSEIRDEECPHPNGSKWVKLYTPPDGGLVAGPDYFIKK